MEKAYEPQKHEAQVYKLWENSGAFQPAAEGEPYCILMPPPNANADLHIGHTLTTTLQDILIRFARMQGKAALYLPGADHAGFETQVVFERELEKQGKSRFDYSREELYQQIWDYVQDNKGKMEDQQRRIGASVDWTRNTFTLDQRVIDRAYQTFQQLHQDGLLYRGKRVVNYCTKHATSFSDLEVEYQEKKGSLWHIDYPVVDSQAKITVATTRPETMLGDTAVAVHPDDTRYANLIGQVVELPLTGRQIPIVPDEAVDPKFGTGAVKVTPAHDPTDYEIGERHNLPLRQVIGTDGSLTDEAPAPYRGLSASEAREKVVSDLQKGGFIAEIEDYTHSVGHCYKCGTVIQPLPLDQWLIHMQPLAQAAIKALQEGKISIIPDNKLKVLFHWLKNIRDWNISRQIAWGIPIPAFIAGDGEVLIDTTEESHQIERGGKVYHKDPDVFDTWFSSGQWPVATLKYPGPDFERFYPTAVMETAGEIIFFWVARMIMLGLYITGEVPFKTVYLHGLVTDEHGKKMSKSRGNVQAPMTLITKYGADATRLGLIAGRSAGLNQGFQEKKVEGYRNFCNKLWNVARFCLDKAKNSQSGSALSPAGHWILQQLKIKGQAATQALEAYRFSQASELVYSLLWDDFADWYIEASKASPNTEVLLHGLETILKLLHPFAPFVTEAIWQQIPGKDSLLISEAWPTDYRHYEPAEADKFEKLQQDVTAVRELRALTGSSTKLAAYSPTLPQDLQAIFSALTNTKWEQNEGPTVPATDIVLGLSEADRQLILKRLNAAIDSTARYLEQVNAKLASGFAQHAPKVAVEEQELKQHELADKLAKLREQKAALGA